MTVSEFARRLVDIRVNPDDFAQVRGSTGLNENALFDALAKEVAVGFSSGTWSFGDCDAVINHLYAFHMSNGTSSPPDFFYSVFLAFDDGEYRHSNDPLGSDPVELYTKPALKRILAP